MKPEHHEHEPPLKELAGRLSYDFSQLVQKEIELGKLELEQKAKRAGAQAGTAAVGGAVLYAGLLALVAAAILGLSHLVASWLAALIVGAAIVLAGALMLQTARAKFKKTDYVPRQSTESIKRDVVVMKEAFR
jgi:cytochrome c biogenesis protein CcdA